MKNFESQIVVADPEVRISVTRQRDTEEDQKRFGSWSVGVFTVEESEALIVLLQTEVARAKRTAEALKG